ncbi:unnamed protein product [Calypogeia fissa]
MYSTTTTSTIKHHPPAPVTSPSSASHPPPTLPDPRYGEAARGTSDPSIQTIDGSEPLPQARGANFEEEPDRVPMRVLTAAGQAGPGPVCVCGGGVGKDYGAALSLSTVVKDIEGGWSESNRWLVDVAQWESVGTQVLLIVEISGDGLEVWSRTWDGNT